LAFVPDPETGTHALAFYKKIRDDGNFWKISCKQQTMRIDDIKCSLRCLQFDIYNREAIGPQESRGGAERMSRGQHGRRQEPPPPEHGTPPPASHMYDGSWMMS
jgi:hypothetical protein